MVGRTVSSQQRWKCAFVLVLGLAVSAQAENWPRFRGPNGQGISDDKMIPVKWSASDYAWKIELPGAGYSSPVVWEDKLFVTSADGKALRGVVLCMSAADGGELWRKEYTLDKHGMSPDNDYASATPAVDKDRVYVIWPGAVDMRLVALTHDGQEVWTAKLPPARVRFGTASSPIVVGDRVIVSREQDKGCDIKSVWLAVACATGEVRWRYEHPQNTSASYSTPCIWRDNSGRDQLIFTSNALGVASVDAAAGTLLWSTPASLPQRVVSSPVLSDGLAVATCGQGSRGSRLVAVKPRDTDSSSATETYSREGAFVPYVPTGLMYEGLLFEFQDVGTVSCLRAATGELLWSEKPAGRYFGSPVCVDGKLYAITVDGDVVVLKAGPKYELLAINPLGEKSDATPAVANGQLLLRTVSHLICIAGKAN
jgi:outer membrane protein assembly factor BamB